MTFTNTNTHNNFWMAFWLIASLLLLTACGTAEAQEGEPIIFVAESAQSVPAQPAPVVESQPLTEEDDGLSGYLPSALEFVPTDAHRIGFTHWMRVRFEHAFVGNSSVTPIAERMVFIKETLKANHTAAQMDSSTFQWQADQWGYDATDLLWEMQIDYFSLTSKAHVLQFRQNHDFAPFLAYLTIRNFAPTTYGDVTIHSVPLEVADDWHYTSDLAHHNVAYLPDLGVLIFSAEIDSIHKTLDSLTGTAPSLATNSALQQSMPRLSSMAAADIRLGSTTCEPYTPYSQEYGARGSEVLVQDLTLNNYNTLISGIELTPYGQQEYLAFNFDNAEMAVNDQVSRQQLLEQASSPIKPTASYGNLFSVNSSQAENSLLIFEISPDPQLRKHPGWPQTLQGWVINQDALFATCTLDIAPVTTDTFK